jgi:signal transduction histidine kinase
LRRSYSVLVRFEDTGPEALLGLARLDAAGGQLQLAAASYFDLKRRFGTRMSEDAVSYRLLADLGSALLSADEASMLAVYEGIANGDYVGRSMALLAIAGVIRGRLSEGAGGGKLTEIEARLGWARQVSARGARLLSDIDALVREPGGGIRWFRSRARSGRTLVYRTTQKGHVVGLEVDDRSLQLLAAGLTAGEQKLVTGTSFMAMPLGQMPNRSRLRTLASASSVEVLPHRLYLVMDRQLPDPLDEVIRKRGQRHLAITGGLVVLLLLGLGSTIRGAARERELARLKSDFVSTVSHELKTPLTSVRMFAEMLQQGVSGGDQERERRYHDIIVKESQRLGLLIANLLDYSQIERGTRRYTRDPVSARDLAADAVESFDRIREDDSQQKLEFRDSGLSTDVKVLVEREVLVQSLLNLLSNAAKYGDGTDIEVSVSAEGDEVIFGVADQGPGIPKSEQQRIFREFYRAPSAYRSGAEGTGLGLALVRRHVGAMGGRVWVASQEGKGATFFLALPRYQVTFEKEEA